MARYALVIGISKYDSFRNLNKAATDAAAIARILQTYGQYQVEPLPKRLVEAENRWELATEKELSGKDLGQALETFLLERSKGQEALIYFAGHGFELPGLGGMKKGYLATSDCTSDGRNAIPFHDLNYLIQQSDLSSLVLILDCCHAGSLLERALMESSLTAFKEKKDYCLITACRSFERAREGEKHGIFTAAVLKGLQRDNVDSEGVVTGDRLFDFVQRELRQSGQEPIRIGVGRSLALVHYALETKPIQEISENIIPYRGLEPFEKEQADFFFGRQQVVEDIYKTLDYGNFAIVVGASGSGKSSVIRAGLVPWLEMSGWEILRPIKPGVTPLAKLTTTFETLFPDSCGQKELYEYIYSSPDGLRQLSQQLSSSKKFLLVIDQFEEVFTLSRAEEQQKFIALVTQVAEEPCPQLAVVVTVRADFLESCLRYPTLTQLIQSQAIFIPPLAGADLEKVISEPARRLGYSLEPGLLGEILHDLRPETGYLPLLQFALLGLWEKRNQKEHLLTISAYQEMGGVFGALDSYAEKVYEKFSDPQKNLAELLCLRLVRTGIELRDTRQRQFKRDLKTMVGNDIDDQKDFERVLQELIDRRLLTSGEDEGQACIDLAHEALMTAWQRFSNWRQTDREYRRLLDRINDTYREWENHQKSDKFLLPKGVLLQAEDCWKKIEQDLPFARELYERSYTHEKLRDRAVNWIETEPLLRRETSNWLQNSSLQPIEKLASAIQLAGLNLEKGMGEVIAPVQEVLYQAVLTTRECNCFEEKATIHSISFNSKGNIIASGSLDGSITLWNFRDSSILKSFKGHSSLVSTVVFSPNGQILASCSHDSTMCLWNLAGELISSPLHEHSSPLNSIAFSPNGQFIASGSADGTICLWDLGRNIIFSSFQGHENSVNSLAFSPNGQLLVSGSSDNTLCLWNLNGNPTGSPFRGHHNRINSVTFSPNGQSIISGSSDGTVCLWDLGGSLIGSPFKGHEGSINSVAFSPSGNLIASGSDDCSIRIWDLKGSLIGVPLQSYNHTVLSVIFSPSEQHIVSCSDDRTIRTWDIESELVEVPVQTHNGGVWSVSFSPNGEIIASGSADKTIRLWDLQGNLINSPFQGHKSSVNSIAFSPDGKMIVSGSDDQTVRLWNLEGELIVPPFEGHQDSVWSVFFSPNSKAIASSSADKTILLWDLKGNLLASPFRGHESSVNSVIFNPDGNLVASCSDDGTVRLWNLQGELITSPFRGHTSWIRSIAFSADGQIIASSSADKTLRLWDLNGNPCGVFSAKDEMTLLSVAISPDNQIIACGGADGTLYLWDQQGNLLSSLHIHKLPIFTIAFSPDSQLILTGSFDKTVRLWRSANWKSWLQICCNRIRNHSSLKEPRTPVEKIACETCQKYVWSQQEVIHN
ncbi:caspase family protein [Leptolyngbya sp. FACHB-16]|uniref:nSTAND1 domain-containing NTPase n=1 Tax=unclassified Leptolyngbya TaxID=2650499 RepID=UPI0016865F2B|nr:caspase family protein [Leptolyngbya sp. FACHB-16]MBD2153096.1 caspase family protein [Leptolyngbya sp. FACHB-16]